MARVIEESAVDLDEIVRMLLEGAVIIYPTDTIYGMGCDALNEAAVGRIFVIKGREFDKPLSVAFSDISQAKEYADLKGIDEKTLGSRLPGPYTIIVGRGNIPSNVTCGLDTVGIRVPNHDLVRELAKRLGRPIVTTSANLSGAESTNDFSQISGELVDGVDLVIDSGVCGSGRASTIIDARRGKILR